MTYTEMSTERIFQCIIGIKNTGDGVIDLEFKDSINDEVRISLFDEWLKRADKTIYQMSNLICGCFESEIILNRLNNLFDNEFLNLPYHEICKYISYIISDGATLYIRDFMRKWRPEKNKMDLVICLNNASYLDDILNRVLNEEKEGVEGGGFTLFVQRVAHININNLKVDDVIRVRGDCRKVLRVILDKKIIIVIPA